MGAPDAPWFTLNTLLGFYDTIERIAIRGCALGGLCFSLILQREPTMRREWTTSNTMSPNLTLIHTGCEDPETNWVGVISAALGIHPVHLPTYAALVEANKQVVRAQPVGCTLTLKGAAPRPPIVTKTRPGS